MGICDDDIPMIGNYDASEKREDHPPRKKRLVPRKGPRGKGGKRTRQVAGGRGFRGRMG